MAEKQRQRNDDKNRANREVPAELRQVVRFPVFNRKYVCPVCEGRKCKACDNTGIYHSEEEWVDVQEHLVLQYLHDNTNHVSMLYRMLYGNMVDVKNLGTVKKDWAAMEISYGTGQLWVAWDLTDSGIQTFYNKGEFKKWLA